MEMFKYNLKLYYGYILPKKIIFEKFKSLGLLKICEIPNVKSFETFKVLILYEKIIT